jgi:hypothetical protein
MWLSFCASKSLTREKKCNGTGFIYFTFTSFAYARSRLEVGKEEGIAWFVPNSFWTIYYDFKNGLASPTTIDLTIFDGDSLLFYCLPSTTSVFVFVTALSGLDRSFKQPITNRFIIYIHSHSKI